MGPAPNRLCPLFRDSLKTDFGTPMQCQWDYPQFLINHNSNVVHVVLYTQKLRHHPQKVYNPVQRPQNPAHQDSKAWGFGKAHAFLEVQGHHLQDCRVRETNGENGGVACVHPSLRPPVLLRLHPSRSSEVLVSSLCGSLCSTQPHHWLTQLPGSPLSRCWCGLMGPGAAALFSSHLPPAASPTPNHKVTIFSAIFTNFPDLSIYN